MEKWAIIENEIRFGTIHCNGKLFDTMEQAVEFARNDLKDFCNKSTAYNYVEKTHFIGKTKYYHFSLYKGTDLYDSIEFIKFEF